MWKEARQYDFYAGDREEGPGGGEEEEVELRRGGGVGDGDVPMRDCQVMSKSASILTGMQRGGVELTVTHRRQRGPARPGRGGLGWSGGSS